MRAVLQRGLWLVAERDGGDGLLGFQCVEPYSPHSRSLAHVGEISTCVAMDVHRRGIGGALCEATFPAARERGYRKLIAAIRADNQPALTFYQEQGFTVIGTAREHVLVGDRYLDEVLTERLLG
jgi:L-amino acid N-acyltransferase YncA